MEEGMTRWNWAENGMVQEENGPFYLCDDYMALRAALEQVEKERDELQQQLNICHGIINAQETTLVIKESRLTDLESQMTNKGRLDYGWWAKKDVPSQDAQTIIKRWEDRWYEAQKYDVNQPMPSFYWVAHQTRCACLMPATEYERNVAYTMMVNKIEYEVVVLQLKAARDKIAEMEVQLHRLGY